MKSNGEGQPGQMRCILIELPLSDLCREKETVWIVSETPLSVCVCVCVCLCVCVHACMHPQAKLKDICFQETVIFFSSSIYHGGCYHLRIQQVSEKSYVCYGSHLLIINRGETVRNRHILFLYTSCEGTNGELTSALQSGLIFLSYFSRFSLVPSCTRSTNTSCKSALCHAL